MKQLVFPFLIFNPCLNRKGNNKHSISDCWSERISLPETLFACQWLEPNAIRKTPRINPWKRLQDRKGFSMETNALKRNIDGRAICIHTGLCAKFALAPGTIALLACSL